MAIFEDMKFGTEAEYEAAIKALFPHTDKFKRLQMLTETNAASQMPLTVLGVLRRRFKSTLLRDLQEEHNLNKIALDRRGRGELAEVVARPRLERDKED